MKDSWEDCDRSEILNSLEELTQLLVCDFCGELPSGSGDGQLVLLIKTCGHSVCGKNPSCGPFYGGKCPVAKCNVPCNPKDMIPHNELSQRIEAVLGIKEVLTSKADLREQKSRKRPGQSFKDDELSTSGSTGEDSGKAKKRLKLKTKRGSSVQTKDESKDKENENKEGNTHVEVPFNNSNEKGTKVARSTAKGKKKVGAKQTLQEKNNKVKKEEGTDTKPALKLKNAKTKKAQNTEQTVKNKKAPKTSTKKSATETFKKPNSAAKNNINKRNAKGESLLHCACRKLEVDKAVRLLGQGADPNTQDFAGWTPLHEVAQRSHVELVRLLLDHEANPNVPGGDENVTPLHDAILSGNADIVQALIEKGADKTALDSDGKTPRDMTSNPELLKLFDDTCCLLTESEQLNQTLTVVEHVVVASTPDMIKKLDGLKGKVPQFQTESKSSDFSHHVTHFVVTQYNDNSEVEPTKGYFEALAVGAWILTDKWIQDSLAAEKFVDEVDYEIKGVEKTVHGGPMEARLNRLKQLPKLFDGLHVYLHGTFEKPYLDRRDMGTVLRKGGAVVLKREPDPEAIPRSEQRRPYHSKADGPLAKCSHLIVYQEGLKCEPQIKYNMAHVKTLPAAWLFECLHNFKLVDPFF